MPSPEELREFSREHITYEVSMLIFTVQAIGHTPETPENAAIRNVLMESFTIHARALAAFLYTPPRGDDASARHYAPSWDPGPVPPALVGYVHRRVGKEVAHLTYTRLTVTPEEKRWQAGEIAVALLRRLRAWADAADARLLHPECRTVIFATPLPAE